METCTKGGEGVWLAGSFAFPADPGWMQPLLGSMCWSCVLRKEKEDTWVSSLPLSVAIANAMCLFRLPHSLTAWMLQGSNACPP